MINPFRADRKPLSSAQAIKLSKTANISATIMRFKATFKNMMHSFLDYAQDLKEDYGARFFDVRIPNIFEEMKSSNFWAGSYRAIYIRYMTVSGVMIKHQGVLPSFEKVDKEAIEVMNVSIIPLAHCKLLSIFWRVLPHHESGRRSVPQIRPQASSFHGKIL